MRRLALSALAASFLALALPAFARDLTAPEAKVLDAAVTSYLEAIETGDATRIVGAIPPRIIQLFAAQSGTDAATLEKTLAQQTESMLSGSRFSDLRASVADRAVTDSKLPDGTMVTWAVIPTEFTVAQADTKTRNRQSMLALREGDRWYFIRTEGAAQQQMVSLAYPFLAEAKYPAASATPLE